MKKKLFFIDLEILPDKGCKMPVNMKGAVVNCYTYASSKMEAKMKVKNALKEDKYILKSLNDCYEVSIDELKTCENISSKELNNFIESDDVFYGTFHGWDKEE